MLSISWFCRLGRDTRHRIICSRESSENSILITEAVTVPNAYGHVRIDQNGVGDRHRSDFKNRRGCRKARPTRLHYPEKYHKSRIVSKNAEEEASQPECRHSIDSHVSTAPVLSLKCSIRYVFHCYKLKKIAKAKISMCENSSIRSKGSIILSHFFIPTQWQPVSIRIFYPYFHP